MAGMAWMLGYCAGLVGVAFGREQERINFTVLPDDATQFTRQRT
jgi:hypothetical protein